MKRLFSLLLCLLLFLLVSCNAPTPRIAEAGEPTEPAASQPEVLPTPEIPSAPVQTVSALQEAVEGTAPTPADPPISADNAGRLAPALEFQDGNDHIYSLDFSPDHRCLAAGTTSPDVHIWDAATGDLVTALSGHTSRVTAVAFSPDGTLLATGSRDKTVILWDTSTWTEVDRFEDHENFIGAIAFSPDGQLLAGGGRPVLVWDVATGEVVFTLEGSAIALLDLAFSPDGSMLAAAHGDAELDLWRMADGEQIGTFVGESTTSHAAFSSNGLLAGASSSSSYETGESLGRIIVWDYASGERVASSQEKLEVLDMEFSRDGSLLIVSLWERDELQLLSIERGTAVHVLREHVRPVYTLALSADGTRLASGDAGGRIIIWSVSDQMMTSAVVKDQLAVLTIRGEED